MKVMTRALRNLELWMPQHQTATFYKICKLEYGLAEEVPTMQELTEVYDAVHSKFIEEPARPRESNRSCQQEVRVKAQEERAVLEGGHKARRCFYKHKNPPVWKETGTLTLHQRSIVDLYLMHRDVDAMQRILSLRHERTRWEPKDVAAGMHCVLRQAIRKLITFSNIYSDVVP
jgi:hypothetical protein